MKLEYGDRWIRPKTFVTMPDGTKLRAIRSIRFDELSPAAQHALLVIDGWRERVPAKNVLAGLLRRGLIEADPILRPYQLTARGVHLAATERLRRYGIFDED